MTQPQKVIKELRDRSTLKGINSWLSVREIETQLNINSAYSVMAKVKKSVSLIEDDNMNLLTGKKWKIWKLK